MVSAWTHFKGVSLYGYIITIVSLGIECVRQPGSARGRGWGNNGETDEVTGGAKVSLVFLLASLLLLLFCLLCAEARQQRIHLGMWRWFMLGPGRR